MSKELIERLRDNEARDCCSQRTEAADRIEELHADLADALDCKSCDGPTALSMVIKERDKLHKDVKMLRDELFRVNGICLREVGIGIVNYVVLAATEPK